MSGSCFRKVLAIYHFGSEKPSGKKLAVNCITYFLCFIKMHTFIVFVKTSKFRPV